MIKILFEKYLLSCDFTGCTKYLHLKSAADAYRVVKENRWLYFVRQRQDYLPVRTVSGGCVHRGINMSRQEKVYFGLGVLLGAALMLIASGMRLI